MPILKSSFRGSAVLTFLPTPSRFVPWLGLALALGALGCDDEDVDLDAPTAVYASWAASPQAYSEALPFPGAPAAEPQVFEDQTLRQIVRLSAGGERLRVRLSNLFGDGPIHIDAAGVARSLGGSEIDEGSQLPLTFGRSTQVTLEAGEELWSDYVDLAVEGESMLAISLYFAGEAPVETVHSLAQQTAYVAAGNAVAAGSLPADDARQSYYWLSGVDVASATERRVVVAFGDSITDGFGSTLDANRRYPDYLSARLTAAADGGPYSVVNAGISGNRVLNDAIGPSGVSRFGRDVLGQSGVTDVVVLLGINDIGFSGSVPADEVSAEAITQGLATLVTQANADGVDVFLGTLTPFQGTMPPYYSDAAEAKRQAVNDWIRASPDVAGVVDFDAALGDPANPLVMQPAFDSGDHLHPNDTGYAAMAEAVDPSLF